MRWVSVRVLPVPGPATTSSGPAGADAATRCSASSRSSRPVPTSSMPASTGSHGRCGEGGGGGGGGVWTGAPRLRAGAGRRPTVAASLGARGVGTATSKSVPLPAARRSSPGSKRRITPYSPS